MSFANIVIGPVIIAVIFGFIVGTRINMDMENNFKFTLGGIIALIMGTIIMSFDIGQFPVYVDLPWATAFLGAFLGILIGSALLGGRAKGDH